MSSSCLRFSGSLRTPKPCFQLALGDGKGPNTVFSCPCFLHPPPRSGAGDQPLPCCSGSQSTPLQVGPIPCPLPQLWCLSGVPPRDWRPGRPILLGQFTVLAPVGTRREGHTSAVPKTGFRESNMILFLFPLCRRWCTPGDLAQRRRPLRTR